MGKQYLTITKLHLKWFFCSTDFIEVQRICRLNKQQFTSQATKPVLKKVKDLKLYKSSNLHIHFTNTKLMNLKMRYDLRHWNLY